MKLELVTKLAQQQVLSPKLLLSMKVLPLTIAELESRLSQELVDNPALELAPEGAGEQEAFEEPGRPFRLFEAVRDRPGRASGSREEEDDPIADLPARPGGLSAHLLQQIAMLELSPEVRAVAEEIIGNLDWRGYLLFPPEEIRQSLPHELKPYFDEALQAVRSLDPAGVGATDVRDCLLLQLARLPERRPRAEQIVRDHFDLLKTNRIPQLAEALGCSCQEVKEELAYIENLSLRPGASFLPDEAHPIRPDVTVEQGEHGWVVNVENDGLPRVQLSETCKRLLSDESLDPEAASFVKKKLESAQWLLQALDGRRRTLRDISEAIMEHQRAFLEHGPDHLVPLRMQTVADAVGVHVSTVSRAVKGKYIRTPWGTYPLRYFFGGGLPDGQGTQTAARVIKDKIADIIAEEDKHEPLSDGELAAKLQAQGFRVSRRTVSKYRSSLNIPPAKLRKIY